jgi:hypothetical protein
MRWTTLFTAACSLAAASAAVGAFAPARRAASRDEAVSDSDWRRLFAELGGGPGR